jgi:hypothetical protein
VVQKLNNWPTLPLYGQKKHKLTHILFIYTYKITAVPFYNHRDENEFKKLDNAFEVILNPFFFILLINQTPQSWTKKN